MHDRIYHATLEGGQGSKLRFLSVLEKKFVNLIATVLEGHSCLQIQEDKWSSWNIITKDQI